MLSADASSLFSSRRQPRRRRAIGSVLTARNSPSRPRARKTRWSATRDGGERRSRSCHLAVLGFSLDGGRRDFDARDFALDRPGVVLGDGHLAASAKAHSSEGDRASGPGNGRRVAGSRRARLRGVSVKTTENHRTRIMAKLDIHDTAGLVRYAIRRGLIRPQFAPIATRATAAWARPRDF